MHKLLGDTDLWNAFKEGDKNAFGELFRRHYSLLYQYGIKLHPDTVVVEDCIQDLFFELWQSRSASPIQSVKAYLLTALKYKLFKVHRDQPTVKEFDDGNDGVHFDISHDNFMIAKEDDRKKTKRVINALQQLPGRQREIIYLRMYQNLSYEEIGEVMGINYQVCRNLLSQSLKSLRKILQG
ncbi:MAG: sigma-70 family RNA polymerase sigma factor [Chitinophagaceae bacterium]|nr:sigma-70 family RNA polymerase sigma factor [Chitinophagaceae bacterium]